MELECSLPHSQESANCPYPVPDQSSPCPNQISEDQFQYYPPIYAWVFQVVSFPEVSPPKPCIHLYSPPFVLHAPPTSFFSIIIKEQSRSEVSVNGP